MEQNIKKTAIERYLKGENPKSIYGDLKRSKEWFFKWIRRYKSGDPGCYMGKSRVPNRQPNALSEIEKQLLISVRHKLESEKFAQIGTSAIKWGLHKSGCPLPSDSSINRVLKREGLDKKTPRALNIRISLSHVTLIIFTRPILSVRFTSKAMANFIHSI